MFAFLPLSKIRNLPLAFDFSEQNSTIFRLVLIVIGFEISSSSSSSAFPEVHHLGGGGGGGGEGRFCICDSFF